MLRLLALLLLLYSPAAAKPLDAFPPDPAGVTVIDRVYEELEMGQQTHNIYAVLYLTGGRNSQLDIYSGKSVPAGREWKKLYSWKLLRGPEKVSVLSAQVHEQEIQIAVHDWFKYVEARAIPVLHYYPKTGKFSEQMAD